MHCVRLCLCRASFDHWKSSDVWRCKSLSFRSFTAWNNRHIYLNISLNIWNPSFAYRAQILGTRIVPVDFLHGNCIYCTVHSSAIYRSFSCRCNILFGNSFCRNCSICVCPWSSFIPVLCRGCTYGCKHLHYGDQFFKIQIVQKKDALTLFIEGMGTHLFQG